MDTDTDTNNYKNLDSKRQTARINTFLGALGMVGSRQRGIFYDINSTRLNI